MLLQRNGFFRQEIFGDTEVVRVETIVGSTPELDQGGIVDVGESGLAVEGTDGVYLIPWGQIRYLHFPAK